MYITKVRTLLALMAGVGAFLVSTGIALAAEPSQGAASVVTIAATPSQEGQVVVSAQFASTGGQLASGQEVSFFLEADFLGQRQVLLGNAITDADGMARVRYTPTWEGTQHIVARLAGEEGYANVETTIAFDVTGLRSIFVPEPPALGRVRELTPLIVGSVVVLVWAIMALVLVRTTYGIAMAGQTRDVAKRYPGEAHFATSKRDLRW